MRFSHPRSRRIVALLFAVLASSVALPSVAAASAGSPTVESYSMTGYEIYFGSDHAVFVGTGTGAGGARELSGWYTSVYHSLVVVPTGEVTGGNATLQRIDGVHISGDITGGNAVQTNPGYNCTTETHAVTAFLGNVTRSDAPGRTGTAVMLATLTHYHAWVFGTCYAYSARIDGTITVIV